MDIDPESVRHLKFAEERGLGTARLDAIAVTGSYVADVRMSFGRGFSKERLKDYRFDHDVGRRFCARSGRAGEVVYVGYGSQAIEY